MIPAAFVGLGALPVTANGKLDRAALPAPHYGSAGGRAAATPTEAALCALVAEVLGLAQPPAADDDFFALGGDSLSAVNLMLACRETFGRDPGLGAVFGQPSIAAHAAAIDAGAIDAPGAAEERSGLGPVIRLGGSGSDLPPLFIVHPAGGIAWCYRRLAGRLSAQRPVYGLQAPALQGEHLSPASLETLAADYVQRIRALRPEGPYHLAGWSVGGIIAQAMAVRLRELGASVGLVALLDSYPSDCWRAEPEPTPIQALRALIAIAGEDPAAHPELTTRPAIKAFLRRSGGALGKLPDAALDGVIRVVCDTNRLVRGHFHRPFDGTLTHVRAALDHEGRNLVADLWRPYAAGLDTVAVPFLHQQLVGEEAAVLISAALEPRLVRYDDCPQEGN
jgi:enterobactin synthetase component F